jgi:hypothetical protein
VGYWECPFPTETWYDAQPQLILPTTFPTLDQVPHLAPPIDYRTESSMQSASPLI